MRITLGEQVAVPEQAFATFADFRTWSVATFELPGNPTEYIISTKYYVKRIRFRMLLNAEDPFVGHANMELRRQPSGLTFALHVEAEAGTCCCVS